MQFSSGVRTDMRHAKESACVIFYVNVLNGTWLGSLVLPSLRRLVLLLRMTLFLFVTKYTAAEQCTAATLGFILSVASFAFGVCQLSMFSPKCRRKVRKSSTCRIVQKNKM